MKNRSRQEPTMATRPPRNSILDGFVKSVREIASFRAKVQFVRYFLDLVMDDVGWKLRNVTLGVRIAVCAWRRQVSSASKRNIPYGSDSKLQTLDVYDRVVVKETRKKNKDEEETEGGAFPVVVFFHGGAWSLGDKVEYGLLGEFLERHGIVAVIANYRRYPSGRIEEMVVDVDQVVDWTLENSRKFGGDPERVFVMGHSSGAHIACVGSLFRARKRKRQPSAMILSAGVYDIDAHYEYEAWRGVSELSTLKPAFGGPEEFDAWSPSLRVSRSGEKEWRSTSSTLAASLHGDFAAKRSGFRKSEMGEAAVTGSFEIPPVYLQTSGKDETVPWHSSAYFHDALSGRDLSSRLLIYDGVAHSEFVTDFMRQNLRDNRSYLFVPEALSGRHREPQLIPKHVQDVLEIVKRSKPAI